MSETWGSPLDRAGEALALHDTRLDPAMGTIAWRTVHPDVRAAYVERARVVLDAHGALRARDEALDDAAFWRGVAAVMAAAPELDAMRGLWRAASESARA